MKLAVFTIKIDESVNQSVDEELLEDLMQTLEVLGYEVIGELTYEDIEDKDDGEA